MNANIPSTVYSVPTMPAAFSIEAWNALVKGSADGTAALDKAHLLEYAVAVLQNSAQMDAGTRQHIQAQVDAIEDKIRGKNNINNTIQAGFQDNLAAQVDWLIAETCSLKETQVLQQEEIANHKEEITKLKQQVASNVKQDSFNAMYAAIKTEIAACYHYLFNGSTIASGDGWVWKADFLRDRLTDLGKSCEDQSKKNFEKFKRIENVMRTHIQGCQQSDSHRSMASNAMQDAGSDGEEMQNADISSPSDSGALSCL